MTGQTLLIIIAIICAYLIGSLPSAYIVGRLRKGVDIRDIGSKNTGAMNVFYKVGFAEGILVLAVDIIISPANKILLGPHRSTSTPTNEATRPISTPPYSSSSTFSTFTHRVLKASNGIAMAKTIMAIT